MITHQRSSPHDTTAAYIASVAYLSSIYLSSDCYNILYRVYILLQYCITGKIYLSQLPNFNLVIQPSLHLTLAQTFGLEL